MKKSLLLTILCLPFMAQANDSTGTVSTGGVEYIKNEHIAMQKENLFISQDKIKVEYEYRNLTDKDITETVLFPLPEVMLHDYGDFADTQSLISSFTKSKMQMMQRKENVFLTMSRTFFVPVI